MIREDERIIDIPGEITSAAVGHVVTAAEDIYDYDLSEYLSVINTRLFSTIEQITTLPDTIHSLTLEDIDNYCI